MARRPQPDVLIVSGREDHETFRADAMALRLALREQERAPAGGVVVLAPVEGLAHPLALEPGLDPAPQTPAAAEVDAAVTAFLRARIPAAAEAG